LDVKWIRLKEKLSPDGKGEKDTKVSNTVLSSIEMLMEQQVSRFRSSRFLGLNMSSGQGYLLLNSKIQVQK
jgi:hypothetical protein